MTEKTHSMTSSLSTSGKSGHFSSLRENSLKYDRCVAAAVRFATMVLRRSDFELSARN